MQKILIWFTILLSLFFWVSYVSADCSDPLTTDISTALDNCFNDWDKTKVVKVDGELNAEGFKDKIWWWIETLGGILAILAVGAIVYGSLLLVLSRWEEEKLKKWKDVIKWWILWFLAVVFAGAIITVVVNIMFSI